MNRTAEGAGQVTSYRGWAGIRRAFGTPSALTMVFLGFGSGLPFLLVGGTLSTWLRDEGLDLSLIGLLSFIGLFYVFKPFWAPFLDRYALPMLGRRRGWLLVTQLVVMASLAGMAVLDPKTSLTGMLWLIALCAFAGATQDILVDAYRIEIAPQESQGALAATYNLGYRLGLIMSGAAVLYLADLVDWRTAYLAAASAMLLPALATLVCREPVRPLASATQRLDLVEAFAKPFVEFFSRNGVLLALAFLAFVGLFKLPDQMLGVLAGPFYLDSGYTKTDIATVSKLYGVWIGLAGAFLGGYCVSVFAIRQLLVIAALGVALSNLAFLLMAVFPAQQWAFFAAITADNGAQGFAGTVLVAFMSGLTNRHFTATQYALLVSLANMPGRIIGGLSGYIVEASSYFAFFLISSLSVVPTLALLWWLWPRIAPSAPGQQRESVA
jgi:MFS transporter, PAT family, beta-lactamase induction signal transducer AmpG